MLQRPITLLLTLLSGLALLCGQAQAQAPANDSLCNATVLTVGAGCTTTSNGDLTGATTSPGEAFGSCVSAFAPPPTNSVWYEFTAPASGLVIVSANFPPAGTLTDGIMTLYERSGPLCSLDSLVELACNDNETVSGQQERLPTIAAELTPGETYYVQVMGGVDFQTGQSEEGTFCIQVEEMQPPVNDAVCSATPVTLGTPVPFHNVGATSVFEFAIAPPFNPSDFLGLESWGSNFMPSKTVWFTFVAPPSGIVEIDLTDTLPLGNFNSKIGVYEATDCNDLNTFTLLHAQLTGSASNGSTSTFLQSNYLEQVSCLTPGQTYYVVVDGAPNFFFSTLTNDMGRGLLKINEVVREPMSIDEVVFDATCKPGSQGGIFAVANGGASGRTTAFQELDYSYAWSNGDSLRFLDSVAPGNYTLTVSDVCDSSATATFTVGTSEAATVMASADTQVCANDMLELMAMASGGTPLDEARVYLTASNGGSGDDNGRILRTELGTAPEAVQFSPDSMPRITGLAYVNNALYGEGRDNQFYQIDLSTGMATLIDTLSGAHGTQAFVDIDYNPVEDRIEGVTDSFRVYVIDPSTATTTLLDTVPWDFGFDGGPGAMAIDTSGQYYFTNASNSGIVARLTTDLLRFDPQAGTVDTLATYPFTDGTVRNLAIDPRDNSLYLIYDRRNLDRPGFDHYEMYRFAGAGNPLQGVGYFAEQAGSPFYAGMAIAPTALPAYTYAWTPAAGLTDTSLANPLAIVESSIDYVVTVEDACGSYSDTVSITVDMPTVALTATADSGNAEGTATATVSGGVAPYTYAWNNGGSTETLSGLDSGTYVVTITDALGCTTTDSVDVAFVLTTALAEQAGIRQWSVYPNPTTGQVRVQAELAGAEARSLTLYSANGQLLQRHKLSGRSSVAQDLSLHGLAPGLYLLRLTTDQGVATQRIVRK